MYYKDNKIFVKKNLAEPEKKRTFANDFGTDLLPELAP